MPGLVSGCVTTGLPRRDQGCSVGLRDMVLISTVLVYGLICLTINLGRRGVGSCPNLCLTAMPIVYGNSWVQEMFL